MQQHEPAVAAAVAAALATDSEGCLGEKQTTLEWNCCLNQKKKKGQIKYWEQERESKNKINVSEYLLCMPPGGVGSEAGV